jgi:hypothetical protein
MKAKLNKHRLSLRLFDIVVFGKRNAGGGVFADALRRIMDVQCWRFSTIVRRAGLTAGRRTPLIYL